MRILVLNGPNINLLGKREPDVYGREDYETLCERVAAGAKERGIVVEIRQSNHEGQLVDWVQEADDSFDGIVINPAAYTHTSIALLDAIKAISIPVIEVHLSDISQREAFRQHSMTASACVDQIYGHGLDSYIMALDTLLELKK